MRKPYQKLIIIDILFFFVLDMIMLFIGNNASLAVFSVVPFILMTYLFFLVIHGVVSYKATKSLLYPHILLLLCMLVACLVLGTYSIKNGTDIALDGLFFVILLSLLVSLISSLLTKLVIKKQEKKSENRQ